eukprot:TRINITY_DN2939_c1_g2_i1.p1 TRINITY_DN2939_c1_g2~~TRINITY_DN2939_c1_g2_i1.p1  ORF type:complete len:514 (+),score=76.41 TRINITY_DN2939_c1_g2_i1:101-1642(+)
MIIGKASRSVELSNSNTANNVAPGSYNVDVYRPGTRGNAPFSTLSHRNTFAIAESDVTPGPSSYQIIGDEKKKRTNKTKKNGNSFTKTKRFSEGIESTKNDGPGPGNYSLRPKWIKSGYFKQIHSPSTTKKNQISSAPSIPNPRQNFGYIEADDGMLYPQQLPNNMLPKDDLPGPTTYSPKSSFGNNNGPSWENSKTNRFPMPKFVQPGPGDYFRNEQEIQWLKDASVKTIFRKFRGSASMVTNEKRTNFLGNTTTPGVGAYHITDDIGSKKKNLVSSNSSFSVTSSRGLSNNMIKRSVVPGPGSYNHQNNNERHAIQMKTQQRFNNLDNQMPGPGSYNYVDPKVPQRPQPKEHIPFGTQTSREVINLKDKNSNQMIGYDSKKAPVTIFRENQPSASFLATERKLIKKGDKVPAVGTYSPKSVGDIRAFSSHKQYRIPKAKKQTKYSDIPAPGSYNLETDWKSINKHKNSRYSVLGGTTARVTFNDKPSTPGVGSYNISTTLKQKSFNINVPQ